MEEQRNKRKTILGVVTNKSGDKTLKITYVYKVPHPKFKKEIKRKTVLHVHDEKNECNIGDRIEIMETRPLSKLKSFRLVKVLEKAPQELG